MLEEEAREPSHLEPPVNSHRPASGRSQVTLMNACWLIYGDKESSLITLIHPKSHQTWSELTSHGENVFFLWIRTFLTCWQAFLRIFTPKTSWGKTLCPTWSSQRMDEAATMTDMWTSFNRSTVTNEAKLCCVHVWLMNLYYSYGFHCPTTQAHAEYSRCIKEADMLENHIIQARAQAAATENSAYKRMIEKMDDNYDHCDHQGLFTGEMDSVSWIYNAFCCNVSL